jgi:hypothetical protein
LSTKKGKAMTTKEKNNSINGTARIAGVLYLSLLPLGIFGLLYVPATLIVPGDIATTASNIMASESLFRASIVTALLVQIVNIFVVLTLYKLLRPVNKNMAVLMVILILLGAPIAMVSEVNKFAVLLLLSGADHLAAFTTNQLQALMRLFLDLHEHGISIASVFWGLWLFPMGYLVFKSGYIPKFIGTLLMIGCFGYLIDAATAFLLPDFEVTVSQFTFIGELLLPLWLLIKGVNVEQWEKRVLQST